MNIQGAVILSGRPGEDHRNGHDRSTPKDVRAVENKNCITFYTLVLGLPNVKKIGFFSTNPRNYLAHFIKKKKDYALAYRNKGKVKHQTDLKKSRQMVVSENYGSRPAVQFARPSEK